MRTKLSIFTFILVLALALSGCGTATPQPRTLNVSGIGTVYLTPDIAYITIGVHTEDPNLASGVSKNNTQAQALVDALKNAGIAARDIQTSNFCVHNNNNGQTFDKTTGQVISNGAYSVDNSVNMTVRDLSHLGSILNTSVASGANNINSISFDVADKTAAMEQARQKAMANANSLANELAKTAGVKLGEIQAISYSDNSSLPSYGMGGGASAPNASVPIQPGQTQISVTVSVTYALK